MNNQWYGDRRDIVKWGTLVSYARECKANNIFQVAMLPEDKHPDTPLKFYCNNQTNERKIPKEVWNHFPKVDDIARLQREISIDINVFSRPFQQKYRDEYFKIVCETIEGHKKGKWIVFLDPDTGIEPKNATASHVTKKEIAGVYEALKEGDALFLYQHAQHCKTWIEDTRNEFKKAIGGDKISEDKITTITSNYSNDVAFFMVVK